MLIFSQKMSINRNIVSYINSVSLEIDVCRCACWHLIGRERECQSCCICCDILWLSDRKCSHMTPWWRHDAFTGQVMGVICARWPLCLVGGELCSRFYCVSVLSCCHLVLNVLIFIVIQWSIQLWRFVINASDYYLHDPKLVIKLLFQYHELTAFRFGIRTVVIIPPTR